MCGGLGAVGHQQAAPGIYRGIACRCYRYYQRPKTEVDYPSAPVYTLLMSIRQIEVFYEV